MDASFITGANATFIAELYATYLKNPAAVDPSWASFFRDLGDEEAELLKDIEGARWAPSDAGIIGVAETDVAKPAKGKGEKPNGKAADTGGPDSAAIRKQTEDSIHALQMIRAYRARGHQIASLDPLAKGRSTDHPELDYRTHGFTDADLGRQIHLGGVMGFDKATLQQILDACKQTYCGTIGVEFNHIQSPKQRDWLVRRFEKDRLEPNFSDYGKKAILERLTATKVHRD